MLLFLLLPLAMASCGDDKDDPTTNTTNDPDGTIIVNVNKLSGVYVFNCYIFLDENYNFHDEGKGVSFSIVGPVKGIGSINITVGQIQNQTWTTDAAVQVGYGYIFKYNTDYYAAYVASEMHNTNGDVMGYTLKVRKLFENTP